MQRERIQPPSDPVTREEAVKISGHNVNGRHEILNPVKSETADRLLRAPKLNRQTVRESAADRLHPAMVTLS